MSITAELGGVPGPNRAGQDAWLLETLNLDATGGAGREAFGGAGSAGDTEPSGGSEADMPLLAMANTMPNMPLPSFKMVKMRGPIPGVVLGTNKGAKIFQKAVEDGAIETSRGGKVVENAVVEAELKQHLVPTIKIVRNQIRDLGVIMIGLEHAAGEFGTQMTARAELIDLGKFQKQYTGLLAQATVHVDKAQKAADLSQPVTFEAELIQASQIVNGVDRGIADVNGQITQGAEHLRKLAQAVETGCNAALTILSVCAPVGVLGKVIEGSIREVEKQVSDRVDGKPFDVGKLIKTVAFNFVFAECGALVNASAEEAIASRVRPALLKRLVDPERVKQAILVLRVIAVATLKESLNAAIDAMLPHENEKIKNGKGTPKFEFAKAVIYEAMKGFVELLLERAHAAK